MGPRFFLNARLAVLFVAAMAGNAEGQEPARALVEDFRIDGAQRELTVVTGILPLANGNLVVMESGDFLATLYSPNGKLLKRFLRQGEGPGEGKFVASFGMLGDTIWVSDGSLYRLSFFDPGGNLLRTIPLTGSADWTRLRPDAKGAFNSRVAPRVLLPGDRALGSPGTVVTALTQGIVKSIPLVSMNWQGDVSGIVGETPVVLNTFELRVNGRVIVPSQPFFVGPLFEMSRNGRHIAFIEWMENPRPVIRITRLNEMGDTIARQEIPYTPIAIPARAVDSAIARMARTFRVADESEVRSLVKPPRAYAPVDRAIVANDGAIWLQAPAANGQRRWTIVSPGGRVSETVVVPLTTSIRWVDGSIWAVSRDADDVPSVVRLRH
jgi:hypothetical protein